MTVQIHIWSDYVCPFCLIADEPIELAAHRLLMARHHEVPMTLPSVSPQPYTGPAFRGAQYAADQGLGGGYHRRLMTAFFQEDLAIRDREVLARLEEAGLDPVAYSAALDQDEYAERHRPALAELERMQITVVPTIVIGGRRINGVATEGVIRRALDEAAA